MLRMAVHLGTHQDPQIPLHLNQLQPINKVAEDQADIQTCGCQVTSLPHQADLLSQMPRSHHLLQHLKKPQILSWLSLNVMWTNNWLGKAKKKPPTDSRGSNQLLTEHCTRGSPGGKDGKEGGCEM
ncbi:hypothetical protein PGT21_017480 [Puccinia graminis f. sp. tritici]|uniref:Uncharacterized protein n=1 Tax=Puccinia graminis f. sp. tritici TaxID=56615 RepID=A0A5B0N8T4_PUCGR|nr:hypothetical protein PGT21_017480 [Puccinia graminis f. sp. tritici]KAA1136131.1 hypothetical protein PGTUg99_032890 [Puccinia graminis f. sp. tritici]